MGPKEVFLDQQQLMGEILAVGRSLRERQTNWREISEDCYVAEKSVNVEGAGEVGNFKCSGTIKRLDSGMFACDMEVVCTPLARKDSKEAATLEEAKTLIEQTWEAAAGILFGTYKIANSGEL